jgi:hypothetical protein
MSTCLQKAISTAQFGTQGLGMPQLFMVNEAEAAAMHVVSSNSAHLGVSCLRLASRVQIPCWLLLIPF